MLSTELAVRLTAASALRMCIVVSVVVPFDVNKNVLSCFSQTLAFDISSFEPFIPVIVPHLLSLISELDTLEGKRRVLGCLSTVIKYSRTRVCSCKLRSHAEAS
jgi:predicted histidine transporter YuiF (NhaC family)